MCFIVPSSEFDSEVEQHKNRIEEEACYKTAERKQYGNCWGDIHAFFGLTKMSYSLSQAILQIFGCRLLVYDVTGQPAA